MKDSNARSVNLTVRYDIDSGFIDPASGKATYDIREIEVGGITIPGVASSTDVRRTPASPTEATLTHALAVADARDPAGAKAELSAVLGDPKLSAAWRILALKTRASVEEGEAEGDSPAGLERDRGLAAALADNRAWSALAPDDPEAARNVAYDLMALGAYDEAVAAYRAIAVKWPDDDYSAVIGIAATYRAQGRYDRALSSLDDLVTRKGPQIGMRFHYHRARILIQLGSMDDAVKDLDSGLEDQPDYTWAFAFRACALASEGRLKEALADQQRAIAEMAKWHTVSRPSRGRDVDQAHAAAVEARLQTTLATGPATKLPNLCDDYWDFGDRRRDRSPLLPALAADSQKP